MDAADGLLRQGAEGYQLTWMDAKVDDWVVTPRRGKPVEINALWYNALILLAGWLREEGDPMASQVDEHAGRARDVVQSAFLVRGRRLSVRRVDGEQGDDAACRPNQILAISFDHPVLDQERWMPVFEMVREPPADAGWPSLAGARTSRLQAAVLRRPARARRRVPSGTVWGWLIGPFVDAWLKVLPDDRASARKCLEGFVPHLGEAGLGTLSEIFDAEEPFTARGCIAQAWTVAEVLRAWTLTNPTPGPCLQRAPDAPRTCPASCPRSRSSSPYFAQSPARCASTARS